MKRKIAIYILFLSLMCSVAPFGVEINNIDKETKNTTINETNKKIEIKKEEMETAIVEIITKEETGQISEEENKNKENIKCEWGNFCITMEDFELICRTVYCESGNQNIDTQIMVAITILNRVCSEIYPNTVKEVVCAPNAYSVTKWKNFKDYQWTESVEQAVTYALEYNDFPQDLFFFRTKHFHSFGKKYIKSGDLYFSTLN